MLTQRHFGLDIARALAIIIVLFQHTGTITSHINTNAFSFLSFLSVPDGVDLFFVLSGFLIGRILLKTDFKNPTSILMFWKRRLLRTLPNYYMFLLLNIFLVYIKVSPGMISHGTLYYFVFFQNLFKPVDLFFWESWSLCIEEWFYFLFPICLLLLYKTNQKSIKNFLFSILLFFLFSMAVKLILTYHIQNIDVDLHLRKLALSRFDTICFGLLLALIERNNPAILKKMKWFGLLIFIAFIFIGSQFLLNISSILYFLMSSASCAAFILFLYNYPTQKGIIKMSIEQLSKTSYSIYLIHLPVLYAFNYLFKCHEKYALGYFSLYLSIVFLLSYINYTYFELYFLKQRDKKADAI